MSGFVLQDSLVAQISRQLPDLAPLGKVVKLALTPDLISVQFDHECTIPVAVVCLQDAFDTLLAARYALSELHAHRIWYGQEREDPDELLAAFFGRFYAEDTALRLYSAGEHLANAIVFMLEISDEELSKHRTQSRVSQQSIVGHYLVADRPRDPVTKAVTTLAQSQAWRDTLAYRNRLVHEQPPTVKGLGIVYNRRKRWKASRSGKQYKLGIGGGDEPDYSVDDLLSFIQPASFAFTSALTAVVDHYIEFLGHYGITVENAKLEIDI
jgi:hypothetical protein